MSGSGETGARVLHKDNEQSSGADILFHFTQFTNAPCVAEASLGSAARVDLRTAESKEHLWALERFRLSVALFGTQICWISNLNAAEQATDCFASVSRDDTTREHG